MKTEQHLYKMAGADNLDEVIANWEAERQSMRELHDNNTALIIYNRRLRLIITLCEKTFEMLDMQGALFLPEKVIETINQVREQIKKGDRAIAASQEICNQRT
jgi:hypothetical protein